MKSDKIVGLNIIPVFWYEILYRYCLHSVCILSPNRKQHLTIKMTKEILINSRTFEVRIALVENGNLAEFYLQRPSEKGLVGNIYKGKVVRVLPGMQAAFVDIGLERTGFLYVDDVHSAQTGLDTYTSFQTSQNGDDGFPFSSPTVDEINNPQEVVNIEDLLKEGQDILVQVGKDPIGTKGARLTCHITLPCRYLVFMPLTDHIGISRKIKDEQIRQQLKEKIEQLRPTGTGFIVRTVAENAEADELEADMEFLMLLWEEIQDTCIKAPVPSLVHEDLDITLRSIRDLFTDDVTKLVIDNQTGYDKLLRFVKTFSPQLQDRIHCYELETPLFEAHGIEVDIHQALEKKVWLRSGGYIVIESTEALTVIDVNTGRFVGKSDLSDTIFKTNIEAVKEIAYQLRLRNIGGIIIIDFIDMDDETHRDELIRNFLEATKKDKSRINILKISEFGLVQMTRKRSCENLSQMMCEPCFYCAGEGILKSRRTICFEILRKICRNIEKCVDETIKVYVNPHLAELMLKDEEMIVTRFEKDMGKRLMVMPKKELHIEKYEIVWQDDAPVALDVN